MGERRSVPPAAANGGLLCTQHPSCSTPQDADRCDDNLYRRAEALYAHIGDAFERQRPATWRASDVMMVPGATSVVDKPLAHSLFDVPNQGTWLVVSFPTVSSVGAMDIVATVAAINCIAGVRVAVMGVKIPLSNDGDGGDNAGRLGEDGPAARRLSLPPLPPFFYVQSAWLSAIKIASLLQGSCDAYTNNAAPAPLSDGYSNIRTKASSPWGHHTPSMYTKLSNSAAFAARLPSPFNAMCVTEAARVLTDAIPTCASASVTMMHTDDFSPALLSIGAVGSWLAFVMETLVQKDALVGRRPAYLKWFSRAPSSAAENVHRPWIATTPRRLRAQNGGGGACLRRRA